MFCLEQEKAKKYSSIKYALAIIDTTYLLLLLFFFQRLGLSNILAQKLSALLVKPYLVIPAYVLAGYLVYYILDFPLNFYASFILEHKFCLSKQKTKDWLNDQIKTGLSLTSFPLFSSAHSTIYWHAIHRFGGWLSQYFGYSLA